MLIDDQVDLLHYANVIDQVTTSKYKDSRPGKDGLSNQRPRTQPEANPANSAKADTDTDSNNGFDSSAVPALNVDRDIDDLRRRVGRRPISRQQP